MANSRFTSCALFLVAGGFAPNRNVPSDRSKLLPMLSMLMPTGRGYQSARAVFAGRLDRRGVAAHCTDERPSRCAAPERLMRRVS